MTKLIDISPCISHHNRYVYNALYANVKAYIYNKKVTIEIKITDKDIDFANKYPRLTMTIHYLRVNIQTSVNQVVVHNRLNGND